MTGLAQVSLKVNPDGTRYSFMNFHTFEYAESAKAQLEDLKVFISVADQTYANYNVHGYLFFQERLIDADDFSLFDFDTKVKFRDPRISTLNAKPTGIYVENLNPTVTPRDLMIIGTDQLVTDSTFGYKYSWLNQVICSLSQCGFVGAIVRNDLKTGVNFAIFNFNSHEGAERAKLILTQMKVAFRDFLAKETF